jgi:uncharacterized protein (UPF0276 family)
MTISTPRNLGFGVGFRPAHYRHVTATRPSDVDWFEVISENFMGVGGRPRRYLESLRSAYPVAMHGVALSIGSVDPLHKQYLARLKELADFLEPALLSDHLCWTGRGGHNSHDLLPMPLTAESLRHVAARVGKVQDFLGRRLFLENPSAYVGFAADRIPEAEFLAELCRRTGCGLLLDVNNLYVNHRNLGLDPLAYLETLQPDTVGQFHLAGHMTERDDAGRPVVRIDTHDAPVAAEVWALYRVAAARFPQAATLIEWDDKIPAFAVLAAECAKARAAHAEAVSGRGEAATLGRLDLQPEVPADGASIAVTTDLESLQRDFLAAVTQPRDHEASGLDLPILRAGAPVPRRVGARVYSDAYYLRIRDCLQETFVTLATICGDEDFGMVAREYLLRHKPWHYSIKNVGRDMEAFVRGADFAAAFDFGVPAAMLADIAALEWADAELFDAPRDGATLTAAALRDIPQEAWESVRFCLIGPLRLILAGCDAGGVIDAVARGETPEKPSAQETRFLVYRVDDEIRRETVEPAEFAALSAMERGESFGEICTRLAGGQEPSQATVEEVLAILLQAIAKGVVRRHVLSGEAPKTEKNI